MLFLALLRKLGFEGDDVTETILSIEEINTENLLTKFTEIIISGLNSYMVTKFFVVVPENKKKREVNVKRSPSSFWKFSTSMGTNK